MYLSYTYLEDPIKLNIYVMPNLTDLALLKAFMFSVGGEN